METHVRCRLPAGGHASSHARRCFRSTGAPANSPKKIIDGQFLIYQRPGLARSARRGDAEDRATKGRQRVVFLASPFQQFVFDTQAMPLCCAERGVAHRATATRNAAGIRVNPEANRGFHASSWHHENFSCVWISYCGSRRKGADVNVLSLG